MPVLGKRDREDLTSKKKGKTLEATQKLLVKAIAIPPEDFEQCHFLVRLLQSHVEESLQHTRSSSGARIATSEGAPSSPRSTPESTSSRLQASKISSGSSGRAILAIIVRDFCRIQSAWETIQEKGYIERHVPHRDPQAQFAMQCDNDAKINSKDKDKIKDKDRDARLLLQWLNDGAIYDAQEKSGLSINAYLQQRFGRTPRHLQRAVRRGCIARQIEAIN